MKYIEPEERLKTELTVPQTEETVTEQGHQLFPPCWLVPLAITSPKFND